MEYLELSTTIQGNSIEGIVKVKYNGRYDGIQVNAHVYDAKGIVRFIEVNGKNTSLYRLFIPKEEIVNSNNEVAFRAVVEGKAERVRLRASMIQEHKEIAYHESRVDLLQ